MLKLIYNQINIKNKSKMLINYQMNYNNNRVKLIKPLVNQKNMIVNKNKSRHVMNVNKNKKKHVGKYYYKEQIIQILVEQVANLIIIVMITVNKLKTNTCHKECK